MAFCTRCKSDLPDSDFSPAQIKRNGRGWCRKCFNENRNAKRSGNGPERETDVCLNCGKDITHMRSHAKWCSTSCSMKGFRANNPGHARKYSIKCAYGLTPADVEAMLEAQGGCCAICRHSLDDVQMNIDHCHTTGRVRGLLCSPCNTGIGLLQDDTKILGAAIEYLNKSDLEISE